MVMPMPIPSSRQRRYRHLPYGRTAALGIQSIPTLFVFRDGILLFQHSGVLPETALSDLVGQASELNMDDVRAQIAEQAAQDSATE